MDTGDGDGSTTSSRTAMLFEYHINDLLLNDCAKNILDTLKSHNHGVGEFLYKFAGNEIDHNWNVKSADLGIGKVGTTDPPSAYDEENKIITTSFNTPTFRNSSDLSWVKTILHESAHAYLATYFAVNDYNTFNMTYPEMVEQWDELENWNDVHQEEFARSLKDDIAVILKEFGQMKGYEIHDQYYSDLAWGGLTETSIFDELDGADQTRIKNVLSIELTGKDLNGDYKNQKGCDAGC
ncbi:hypothetical protein DET49_107143 [Salegentibacter sp. 24]|uniref:hypothetical protein n=1 Tax=Salegentibacter sp. 24 TaxID=2183986 RepID=UPI00105F229A|nr:hypothetical protein [Salegentibacter sp. 24]TDN89222.1 hypothetical protein DET49_107143 [Salegentibacter sp. 24]